jgi:RNA polymerase sigma-70 factor, ECF subfamily
VTARFPECVRDALYLESGPGPRSSSRLLAKDGRVAVHQRTEGLSFDVINPRSLVPIREALSTLGMGALPRGFVMRDKPSARPTSRSVESMSAQLRLVMADNPTSWTEEDIKAVARERTALGIDMVTRKFRDRLFYHALYIVKDAEEAHDVIQEVLIKAIRERRFFDADFRMKAWLFRVTSNLCFNIVRDRRRRGDILDAAPRKEHTDADQMDLVFQGEQRTEVLKAIDGMNDDHKEILMLRYYDDLSYAEIAEVLEIKLGTVMSRLSRARGRLQEVIDGMPATAARHA